MSIVIGFVPTPEGHAALVRAADEARLRRASLVVVSSTDPERKRDREVVARFEKELDAIEAAVTDEGLGCERRGFDRGRLPSEDLLEVADEVDAELIVIGLRRRSSIGKLVLGSQAQTILLEANQPVLAVKATRS